MNCEKDDLAVIVHPGPYHGRLVKCIYISPGAHTSPSGWPMSRKTEGAWVVESLSGLFTVKNGRGELQETMHPAIDDKWLRPLRDNDGEDEMLAIARLKDEEKARAMQHAMQARRERLREEAPKQ